MVPYVKKVSGDFFPIFYHHHENSLQTSPKKTPQSPGLRLTLKITTSHIIQSKHTSKLVISAKIQAIPEKDFSIASIAAERQHYIHCCRKQRLETVEKAKKIFG